MLIVDVKIILEKTVKYDHIYTGQKKRQVFFLSLCKLFVFCTLDKESYSSQFYRAQTYSNTPSIPN